MKTSAVAVRSVLRDGLEHPSGYQTARAGLATFTAVKLYRDGLDGRYKRLRRFPPLSQRCALRAGGRSQRGGAALAREPWPGGRQLHATRVPRSRNGSLTWIGCTGGARATP